MNVLLTAATAGEIAPTQAWLRARTSSTLANSFTVSGLSLQLCLTGVGIMAATESITRAMMASSFDFAVQAGVAGAFNRSIPLGEVVRVENEVLADLGAEDRDGSFLSLHALGLAGGNDAPYSDGRLPGSGSARHFGTAFDQLRGVSGITVQTVSGTEKTIAARASRYGADVETMEGAPFHYCCLKAGVPFVQLRSISNYVEPRDRSAWQMGKAVASLNEQLIHWLRFLTNGEAGSGKD